MVGYTVWCITVFNFGSSFVNIFLADLFFTLNNTEIANYADDTMSYAVFDDTDDSIASFAKSSKCLLISFHDNLVKSNLDKWHLPVMEIVDFEIEHSTYEKLPGNHFDNRLTFDYHISELCKKKLVRILMH